MPKQERLVTERLQPTPEGIDRAAELLRAGELVAFPTETVYGLGADATNSRAVAAIFSAKDRPAHNPLIVHVPDAEAAFALVQASALATALAAQFWPGALTMVLPLRAAAPIVPAVTAGLPSLAIRVPSHALAQELLRAVARPIAAPSANPSGRVSATSAAHVLDGLGGRIAAVLDGGDCAVGLESTILAIDGQSATLLRPGGITREAIEEIIGPLEDLTGTVAERPTAPGQLEAHYAPNRPLRLEARDVAPDEALLAFGPDAPAGAAVTLNLSPTGDLGEAAHNLFAMLRELDQPDIARIAVMPIPSAGLGRAINDRLRRAAAST